MNEYDNEERLADNALDLWLSNPPQHTVTLCHRTNDALDEYGNVLGGFTVSRERSGWHLSLYSVTGCMYNATLTDRWQEKVLTRLSECSKLIAGQQAAARSSKKTFQKPLASPKDFSHTRFTPKETGNKLMFNTKFDQFACVGDSITVEIEGVEYTATILFDTDSTPYDVECYSEDQTEAWRKDDWCYVGVVISAENNGWVNDHVSSLWGLECGLNPQGDGTYFTEIANDLLSEK